MSSCFFTRCLLLLSVVVACTAGATSAAEPPTDPTLRIETGMHSAPITRIATDAEMRWLATASDDKTLRVWDLQSGTLLQIIRPPTGDGSEGRLFSVAMSPGGDYVAAGGWTGYDWDRSVCIYIFQRATGRLVRRITGLPQVIYQLAWSPDGRYLAAGIAANNGIRVYRASDFTLLGQDTDFGGNVLGIDFDHQGRLVASSFDGMLRLYRVEYSRLQLLAKKAPPGGKQPYAVRFSPDGTTIAVGFNDTINVNLLSAESLDFLHAPDVTGLAANLFLSAVSWSADGRTIYAGGIAVNASDQRIIRAWSQRGRGPYTDLAAANDTVMDIQPLVSGGMVYTSAGWGIFDAGGRRTRLVALANADFRDNWEGFRVSNDGLSVRFCFETHGRNPIVYNLETRNYQTSTSDAGIVAPRFSASGIEVREWKNTTRPTLNGLALKLQNMESSVSLAIAPDGQSFVLGTNWNLRRFDSSGREVWKRPAPGTVAAVNISGDGRLVVAAYADGTIRWHRLSDGRELAAFFPHSDRSRWVLWTPGGYYDASPGAEDLIGWHLNRGKDNAADFFPASRFRSQFYRPDVIAKMFDTLDEGEALRLANADAGRKRQAVSIVQSLPPVVEILSPQSGTSVSQADITLRIALRAPADAPVTATRVRVNGLLQTDMRNLTVAAVGNTRDITVRLPAEDAEIQVFAENRNGVSTPASLRVRWAGMKPPAKVAPAAAPDDLLKPKLYVLAVGMSKYRNPDFNLDFAAKDARDFTDALKRQKGLLYRDVEVKLLTDAGATKDDVLDGLEWLKQQVTSRDVGILFLAGHGMNDNAGNYYFLPHNVNSEQLLRTGVAHNDIKLTLNSIAGKALFFIDTCHSGNALGTAKTRGFTDINAVVSDLASAENGVVVFTASTGRQFSQESPAWANGAFTKAVVEGLTGQADYRKTGTITHKGLDFYVTERVKELTKGQQSPVSIAPQGVTDFPIAMVRR